MSTKENQSRDENFYIEKEKREFQEAKERHEREHGKENLGVEDLTGINDNVSGDDRSQLNKEERHFQEKHGNRKYQSFTNHDSSHDQPTTTSGPGTV
ncbi:hypothetical protein [Flavobacterium sp.]|jgi:hypothetical protein|uniref:hypothetical protein n=1 Tax=Flavobacterium sp. TaxID=239 RepID=UPI0037BFF233